MEWKNYGLQKECVEDVARRADYACKVPQFLASENWADITIRKLSSGLTLRGLVDINRRFGGGVVYTQETSYRPHNHIISQLLER
jgi:hypothetical protein